MATAAVFHQTIGVEDGASPQSPRASERGNVVRRSPAQASPATKPERLRAQPVKVADLSYEAVVNLARWYVLAHIGRRPDRAEIVTATGVSESTVRRAVKAETGENFGQFVTNIRLDRARAWLSTNRESRSQAQIAAALGFGSAAAFGRSYRTRFGETMTQTRKQAVLASAVAEYQQSNRLGRESICRVNAKQNVDLPESISQK